MSEFPNPEDDDWVLEVAQVLEADPPDWNGALRRILARFEGGVGTLHRLDDQGILHLELHRGLPKVLLPKVERIPVGKGMAGLAAERLEPVQVCNLQSDESGVAKPAAKLTQMEGAISMPCLHEGVLVGTLGVAKPNPHEYDEAEIRLLEVFARAFAKAWAR